MKTRITLLFALLLPVFFFNSCQEDEVLSTTFSVVLYQDFTIDDTNDTTLFHADTLVDASAQSGDIEKYKDKIQQVTLTKVTYMLTAFNGDPDHELVTGAIGVADENQMNWNALATLNNVNLQSLLNNETELTLNQTAVDQIVNQVENDPHKFWLEAGGYVSEVPLNFTLRIRFYLDIKAGIL